MKFFRNYDTVGDIKTQYRELCFKYHPDVSGYESTADMQELNTEYLFILRSMDGQVSKGTDGKEHAYRYNDQRERDLVAKMAAIIRAKLPDHITVEIVGIYIWVSGTRREDNAVRESLKELKLNWHSKRIMWYWKPDGFRTQYNGQVTYDDLKVIYGCQTVEKEARSQPTAPAMIGA